MKSLFAPRGIAIYGASNDPDKIGGRSLHMMKTLGFEGGLYPISPLRSEVQGLRAYATAGAIEAPVDLALIALSADQVDAALADCAGRRIPHAVVFSSGFAETGVEGRERQSRIAQLARESGMRIVGPNCLGVVNVRNRLFGTFSKAPAGGGLRAGRISVASQSGAFGSYCLSMMLHRQLGLNHWITTGNQVDVDFSECIRYFAEDEGTDVIVGYLEAVKDSQGLLRALQLARKNGKRVVMMKVGSSKAGARAAASHTASLVGSDRVYDAVLREWGVYRARNIEEMFDIAYAAATVRSLPTGRRIGLLTVSGGVGVHMADEADRLGMDVAPMPADAQAELKAVVPFAGTENPVDVTAQLINDPALFRMNLELMLVKGRYDVVVAFLAGMGSADAALAGKVLEQVKDVLARLPASTIVISMLGPPEVTNAFSQAGALVFEDPARALRAAAALMKFGAAGAVGAQRSVPAAGEQQSIPPGPLDEMQAKRILAKAGIPVLEEVVAATEEAAVAAAEKIGYPVVLKVLAAELAHKSDVGGVILDLRGPAQLREAWRGMMVKVAAAAPGARIGGAIVAPMLREGVETILGVSRDPVFGPVVMFGMGGVLVEALDDVTCRIAPFGVQEAHAMISEIRGKALLQSLRGRPPGDVDALAQALSRLSIFAAAHAQTVDSIDINPFVVLPAGQGAVALDALVVPVS